MNNLSNLMYKKFSVHKIVQYITKPDISKYQIRLFVSIGDKVPVNYIKDEKVPQIQENSQYPDWLFDIGKKGLSKNALIAKMQSDNGLGLKSMTFYERKRLKRMITLETIKENNLTSLTDK